MQLSSLITRLPEGAAERLVLADPEADVYTVQFLTQVIQELRDDVLYFGDETMLATVDVCPNPNIVLLGSADVVDCVTTRYPDANVILLSADADPYTCFNALQAYFFEAQEQVDVTRRMLAAHFSNGGLQYLIEESAMALGNPIVVVDTTYRYIAHHLADLEGVDSTLAHVMFDEIQHETVLDNAVRYIREQGIDSKIAQLGGPLIRHNDILDCNTMTGAVMVRGVCIAHVMMMEHARPFTDLDRECFDRLLAFVGQEMQKSEVWGPTSGELGSYFLGNLLGDRNPSEAVTRRRLKAVNFHAKAVFEVICLHAGGEGLRQDQVEMVAGQLRPMLHHAIYTSYHGNLVVLASRDAAEDFAQYERLLREVAALNNLAVGISNVFERITETSRAYRQARSAIRLGELARAALDERGLYRYRDYAYLHLIDIANRHTSLLDLCHPAVLRLAAHDERHGGELMETLYCYLQVSGITKRAAQMLNLHKNTLLYRINRVKEILGMDLSSGEDQFALQMSFRILLYLGIFTPRVTVSRDELRS